MTPATRRAALAVTVWCALLAAPRGADANGFSTLQPTWGDAGFLMVMVPLALAFEAVPPAPHARSPHAACAAAPIQIGARVVATSRTLDCRVRDGGTWRRPEAAAHVSDALLYAWLATPALAPAAGQLAAGDGLRDDVGAGTLFGIEAFAATYVVTGLIKHTIRRVRPGGADGPYDDAYASFPSGHTSMAFAGATLLTLYASEYGWGGRHARWAVPASAYATAAFTGYLRIGARRHWLTDVFVGALVGTGTTLVTHAVRL